MACMHVIPGFHPPYNIVDVSLRHMQHLWLASTVPQGWQNPVNFAQSHHHFCSSFRLTIDFARPSIPSTAPFPWDVEKYFHEIVPLTFLVMIIVPLVHELWLYDDALLWNISN